MSIKLDLKQFKHISSDGNSTKLQHKAGHMLTIAHSGLSKEGRAQLEALSKISKDAMTSSQANEAQDQKMAEGGEVKKDEQLGEDAIEKENYNSTVYVDDVKKGMKQADVLRKEGAAKHGATIVLESKKKDDKKEDKKPKKMAEGGDPGSDSIPEALKPSEAMPMPAASQPIEQPQVDPSLQAKRQLYNQVAAQVQSPQGAELQRGTAIESRMFGPNGEAPKDFDANAWQKAEQLFQTQQMQQQQAQAKETNRIVQDNAARQAAGLQPLPVPTVQADQQGQPATAETIQAQQPATQGAGIAEHVQQAQSGLGNMMQMPEDMVSSGYKDVMQGMAEEAKAVGALGQQQAALQQQAINAQQQAQDSFKQQFQNLEKERQDLMHDVQEGHVSVDKFWTGDPKTGEGGHSKLMTGIGMILAGFNPTNNPNAAINFLKFQMEQNLNAQAKNLDSKQNLLAHNLRQFGNLKDATEMTRLQQNDILAHQLDMAAANAKLPMAQAAAKQAAGKFRMDSAGIMQNFAMRRAMLGLAQNSNPSDTAAQEQMIAYMRMTNPEMAKEMESRLVPGVGMAKLPIPTEDRREIIGKQNFDTLAKHYVDWVKKNSGTLNPAKMKQGATMAAELQSAYRNAIKGGVYKEGEQEFIEKLIPSDPAQFAASIRTLPKLEELLKTNQIQLNGIKRNFGLPESQMQQENLPIKGKDGKMYIRQGNFMVPVKGR